MYGAILGDIIGSPYEFDMGDKIKEFPLFSKRSEFTDDSVMTIAVAEAFMDALAENAKPSDEAIKEKLVFQMQKYGKRYPHAGYGGRFSWWLRTNNPEPYNSFGNGSAMRVSSVAWLFDSMETV